MALPRLIVSSLNLSELDRQAGENYKSQRKILGNTSGARMIARPISRRSLDAAEPVGSGHLHAPAEMVCVDIDGALLRGGARRQSLLKPLVAALRPHQWAKNLLLLLPLFLAHQWTDAGKLALALLGMAAFSAAASAVYIVNDMLDMDADRRHPSKRRRPFAAGDLSVPAGLGLAACLATAAGIMALGLTAAFIAWLMIYLATTTAYSLSLKKHIVIDVIVLAGLYTLRIAAGAAAVSVPVSPWLLAFAMFFFLSLAMGKRYIELRHAVGEAGETLPGRGYRVDDAPLLQQIGATSGYLAVLVFCLYIDSGSVERLYRHRELLWLACPLLLYWITRFWLLAQRRQIPHDPVLYALRDRISLAVIAATAATVLLAAR